MKELTLSLDKLNTDELGTGGVIGKDSSDVCKMSELRQRFARTSVLSETGWNRSNDSESDNGFAGATRNSFNSRAEPKACVGCEEKGSNEENRITEELTALYNVNGLPEGFHKWTVGQQDSWVMENVKLSKNAMPESLHYLFSSLFRPGDCGRSPLEKPDWLDIEKFRRGQQFARDNYFGVNFANLLGLYQLFTFKEGVDPLIFTGRSHTPYLSFKRYLSTALRIRNWYRFDPWEEGSPAYKDMLTVRRMHKTLRHSFDEKSNETIATMCIIDDPCCPMLNGIREDFQSRCSEPAPGQCAYRVLRTLAERPKGMNQGDMTATQFAFVGIVVLYPQYIGIHYATDEELEAYCHTWRAIGYLLGIEDEFNFCRGTLKEIQQRSRDFIEFWVKPNFCVITPEWEHMVRCLMEGIDYYFPSIDFEVGLLHLADFLDLDLPNVYASLDYVPWFVLHASRWFLHYACKSELVRQFINNRLNYALDCAAKLSPEKHVELQEKSAKRMEFLRSAVHT